MNNRIKYICYYDTQDSACKRNYVLSAANKLEYIWEVIGRTGYKVDVISISNCVEKKIQYIKGETKIINDAVELHLFPSFGGSKIVQWLGRYYLRFFFIIWFISHVHKGEKVLVYHSLGYCKLLLFLKHLVGCSYIGEIEELYQDVVSQNESMRRKEIQFIEACDSFIFPSELLNAQLNKNNDPYLVIQGIYRVEPDRGVRWNDTNKHIVYAGTFDRDKGVLEAIHSAEFLPQGYHVHIIGFGKDADVEYVQEQVIEVSRKTDANISYDGCLTGEAFIQFIQKCDIGLCPQNPAAAFNATSFPSKILTYLSNGLQVVTISVPAIRQSVVDKYLHFYDEQTPELLAGEIVRAATRPFEGIKEKLLELDTSFEESLRSIL